MGKSYKISEEEAKKISELRKTITDKRVDRRLHAAQLRGEGYSNEEIAQKLDTVSKVVSRWICQYAKNGAESLYQKKIYNHKNMSYEEEEQLLSKYIEQSDKGQLIEVSEIEQEYQKTVGHSIGGGQIYRVLARHGWKKKMPRSKHPKKASDEAIEASKKLKQK